MKDYRSIFSDVARIARNAVVRGLFWKLLFKVWVCLLILTLALEIPAFLVAREQDQHRALQVLEGRRKLLAITFARIFKLRENLDQSQDAREVEFHMRSILQANSIYPGLVGIGTVYQGTGSNKWEVHGQVTRSKEVGLDNLLQLPLVRESLERTVTHREPNMSPLFEFGTPANGETRVMAFIAFPLRHDSKAHPQKGPSAQVMVVDIRLWAREIHVPESLRSLNFYVANDPPDHIFVPINEEDEELAIKSLDSITIELDSQMTRPLGSWFYYFRKSDSTPSAQKTPSKPTHLKQSALLKLNSIPSAKLRCYVEVSEKFRMDSAQQALIREFPYRAVQLLVISILLVMMWMVFTASRQQMSKLAEAQQTISRLNLHRTMVQQELHDHIIQNLTLLGVQVATTNPQDVASFKATRDAILKQLDYLRRELRRLLVEGTQRLQSFDEMAAQLQSICRHMEGQFGVRCSLATSNPGQAVLPPEILFRTCRFVEELIGNAIRHGGAKKVVIAVDCAEESSLLQVKVEDDGKGFDPNQYSPGFGLQSMAAFARRARGTFEIHRRQPRGMIIYLKVPFTPFKGEI